MTIPNTLVPRQIVVVDDNAMILGLVVRSLTAIGHSVIPCESFEAGRAALDQLTPDLIIVDIRLAGYNGLQLIMLAKHRNPQVRAIAITGFDDLDLRNEAAKMGASFLTKPFSPSALQAAVEQTTKVIGNPTEGKQTSGTVIWNPR